MGSSHPSGKGELGSAEGVEEHQARAGVTRNTASASTTMWGREKSLGNFRRWRRRRITNTSVSQLSGKVVFNTPGSLAKGSMHELTS